MGDPKGLPKEPGNLWAQPMQKALEMQLENGRL
jgi:hypothetical protein